MKKYLAVLFSIALFVVVPAAISGCHKSQTSQQQSVQQPGTATTPSASNTPQATTSTNLFEAFIQRLPSKFNPASAVGVTCTYQFNITDTPDKGLYWVKIANDQCTVGDGPVPDPTLTITTPEKLWFEIVISRSNGGSLGTSALLSGQYSATPRSNIVYLRNMREYFSS